MFNKLIKVLEWFGICIEEVLEEDLPLCTSTSKVTPKNLANFPYYFAEVPNFTHLDIYMVSEMFQLNSYQHHIIKKAIATGKRGSKDQVKDLQEVIATAEAWIESIKANKVL